MFKGLFFFLRFGWKADKRYVLWNVFSQLLSSLSPIFASLHKGILAEYGTHGELMQKNARYADLYRMQAQFYT